MKRNFVTGGRAAIAYIVGIATGAIAFLPLLTAINALHGGTPFVLRSDQVHMSGAGFWLRVELGAMLLAFMLPAATLLPVFVAAMVFARWKQLTHWSYYTVLGMVLGIFLCVLILYLGHEDTLFHSIFVSRSVLLLAMLVGFLGGGACWLFLWLTYRKNKQAY